MRPENRGGEGECYQVNQGVKAIYSDSAKVLEYLAVKENPVDDSAQYTIGLQGFHSSNSGPNLGLTNEELTAINPPQVVATSARDVLEEHLRGNQNLKSEVEGRLVFTTAA